MDIGVLVSTMLLFLLFFKTNNNNSYYALISSTVLFIIHFTRRDIDFLKNILGKQFYISLALEYLIIWMFINVFFIFKENNFIFLGNIFICFILPLLQLKKYFANPSFINKIPNALLELKAYMRKNIIIFFSFVLLSVFLGYHPATLVILGLCWLHILLHVYSLQENKEILILQFSRLRLEKKVMYSFLICWIISIPAIINFAFLNPLQKDYIVYFSLYLFLSNYVIIINKYAGYNEKIKVTHVNDAGFFKFTLIIGLLIPAIIYIINNRKSALNKIARYV
ncbi:hypothetical protein LXM63_19615 [Chryseobacterium gleum]|uniref:hypothetical protein n=1 Tax=Chryseobacterium gleum TaxID=250 RepID=UPI001E47D2B7|nr:hypothetical protein [Chryseobacterium gleum]MCE4067305.1 hypothetical protein [Chryseobacterium gleum]